MNTDNKETIPMEAVEELLMQERQRCMDIAKSFMNKYDKSYKEKRAAGQSLAFVQGEMSEVSRYIMNAISGRTALNADEPLINLLRRDYPNLDTGHLKATHVPIEGVLRLINDELELNQPLCKYLEDEIRSLAPPVK